MLSQWYPLAARLDHAMLIYTTFFLGNLLDKEDTARPAMLTLYFTSRSLRSVYYMGYSIKLAIDYVNGDRDITRMFGAGLLLLTALLNFPSQPKNNSSSWRTTASDGSVFGSWWAGAGNGDWFAFFGHNSEDEKTIIPATLLEQMHVQKGKPKAQDNDIIEEIN